MGYCLFELRSNRLDSSGRPMELSLDMEYNKGYPYRLHTVMGDSSGSRTSILERVAYALSHISNELVTSTNEFSQIVYVPFLPMDMLSENDGRIINCVPKEIDPDSMVSSIVELHSKMSFNQRKHFVALVKTGLGFVRAPSFVSKGRILHNLTGKEILLMYNMAHMCSVIDKNTFICMDSPEMVVSHDCMYGYVMALNNMLKEFDSHVLIATDSPEVISETLGTHTTRLVRWRNPSQTVAKKPLFNAFACLPSEILSDSEERLSYRCLKDKVDEKGAVATAEELSDLGFNALMRLKLYDKAKEELNGKDSICDNGQ